MGKPKKHVFICTQSRPEDHPRGSCAAKGSGAVLQEFMQQFEKRQLWGRYAVAGTSCLGTCGTGPSVLVYPEGVMYGGVKPEDVNAIIEEHLLGDKPVERLKLPDVIW
ncbi:(2Fe-2S) ferredoxin domain-containing protein [Candidatus Ferrigenium straubiae]|jgi:(2Fe-2S) ferredoxin|uniref:(2Fe-2S) ferredoxin domain-containing protein n=1 Tax=Candidatus Ferrigenium straubiae TaxID=2919506 RepID=UPI003F4AA0D2